MSSGRASTQRMRSVVRRLCGIRRCRTCRHRWKRVPKNRIDGHRARCRASTAALGHEYDAPKSTGLSVPLDGSFPVIAPSSRA